MTTIGRRLRNHVASAKGWSMKQLAAELGVSYETVRKWETGETAPSRRRVKQIADLLGKTEHWVVFGQSRAADEPALRVSEPPALHRPPFVHWRFVADTAARQLSARKTRVDPAQFLAVVDVLAEAIPHGSSEEAAGETVSRHLRLVGNA